jgi:flagellar M-ring protein FliF
MVPAGKGKRASWVPRTPAEMQEIQQLAQAAVGFDLSRGDHVTVQNLGFASNADLTTPSMATRLLNGTGDNLGFVRYGVLLVVFILALLFIVRPVLGQLKQLTSSVQTLPVSSAQGYLQASPAAGLQLDKTDELSFERQQARAEMLFDNIADFVKKEPQQGTRLLQSWVRSSQKS